MRVETSSITDSRNSLKEVRKDMLEGNSVDIVYVETEKMMLIKEADVT